MIEILRPDEGLSAQERLDNVIEQVHLRERNGDLRVGYLHGGSRGENILVGQSLLKVIYVNDEVDLCPGQYGVSHGHGGCQAGIFEYSLDLKPFVGLAHVFGGTPERMVGLVREIIDRGGDVGRVTLFARSERDIATMVGGLKRLVDLAKIRSGLVDRTLLGRYGVSTYRVWVHHGEDGTLALRLTIEGALGAFWGASVATPFDIG